MSPFQSGSDRSTPPFSLADGQSGDQGDILQELTESLRREKKLKHQVSAASHDTLKFLSMMIDSRHHTGVNLSITLRYDLPNGCTYLQLGRDFINLFYLNICHFKTIHRTTFLSFWIF